MNITNFDSLISSGRLSNISDLNPATSYIIVGVLNPSTIGGKYPLTVLPISQLGGGSADNGLTKTSGVTQLGGNLVQDTNIGGAFSLSFVGNTNFQVDSDNIIFQDISNNNTINVTSTDVHMRAASVGEFTIDTAASQALFIDNRVTKKGIEYNADYSSSFVANSLISKTYADNIVTGKVTAGSNVTITGSGTSGSPYVINAAGGGGGSQPANQIVVGTGAGDSSYAKFTRNITTGQILVGNSNADIDTYRTDVESMVAIARSTNPAVNTNAHGFVDASVFSRSNNSLAYNSFTANVTFKGSATYDHYAAYQSAFILDGTAATLGTFFGFTNNLSITAGNQITTVYGMIVNDPTGAGSVVDNIGIQVPTLAKGSGKNFALNVVSNDSNFGGNLRLTTAGASTGSLTPQLSFYHATSFKTAYITSKLNANSSEIDFYVAGVSLAANKLILRLNGDDDSNTGTSPNKATLDGILTASTTIAGSYNNSFTNNSAAGFGYVAVNNDASKQAALATFGSTGGVSSLYVNNSAWLTLVGPTTGIVNEEVGGQIIFANGGTGLAAEVFRIDTSNNIFIKNGRNLVFDTTTGTKIGTGTNQKLGFYNTTPVIQQTTGVSAATFVANTSGIANDTATFGGYTMGQVVAALKLYGLLA